MSPKFSATLLGLMMLLAGCQQSPPIKVTTTFVPLEHPHGIVRKSGTIVAIEPVANAPYSDTLVVTFRADGETELIRVTVLKIPEKLRLSSVGKRATYVITLSADDLKVLGVDPSKATRLFHDAFQDIAR